MKNTINNSFLGWFGIFRLGLVQTSLGAIVVLTTSTINRVMVVEYALPAMLPGALVGMHYAIQIMRPRFGYGSDMGGRRTPWIIGGMATLAIGGVMAAVGTGVINENTLSGIVILILAFLLIGAGVGASGTSLLVLLAKQVSADKRAAAASIVWFMMIMGFALTAGLAGHFLDPFSAQRLVIVSSVVSIIAFCVTLVAVFKLEKSTVENTAEHTASAKPKTLFREALHQVWQEPQARLFTIFIFISMLAYSAQDLILEPFAGTVFSMTPGESTQLSGLQHGGVLVGMIMVAIAGTLFRKSRFGLLKNWSVGGCIASAFTLFALAYSGFVATDWPLHSTVFILGITTGAFAVAAIGSMMALVGKGREKREGVRMGLWGAAQATAFGFGGFIGTVAIDITRYYLDSPETAYAIVFACEGVLFLVSAYIASTIQTPASIENDDSKFVAFGDSDMVKLAQGR